MATALKNEGKGWEGALAAGTAKLDKADAERTENEVKARAAYDKALAEARRHHDNRLAQADLAWAQTVAPARAAAYINGDTASYSAAKDRSDLIRSRDQAASTAKYTWDVGLAKIAQALGLGDAQVIYAGKQGDAISGAVSDINAAETTFASAYATVTNTLTVGVSQAVTGLLSGVVGAFQTLGGDLNTAMMTARSSFGMADVTRAGSAAQAEADHHAGVALDHYRRHAVLLRHGRDGHLHFWTA